MDTWVSRGKGRACWQHVCCLSFQPVRLCLHRRMFRNESLLSQEGTGTKKMQQHAYYPRLGGTGLPTAVISALNVNVLKPLNHFPFQSGRGSVEACPPRPWPGQPQLSEPLGHQRLLRPAGDLADEVLIALRVTAQQPVF